MKDVPAEKFIKAFAQHMKNQDKIDIPKWAESGAALLSPWCGA